MNTTFNLEEYLSNGVQKIVKGALQSVLKNPKQSIFIAKYIGYTKEARKIRIKYEQNGTHIPPFLIASITSSCNLHCKGCYARANQSCTDEKVKQQLFATQWSRIFKEANELGIQFILLAGGEPMIRDDVISSAARFQRIIFPIFTNGTMITEQYVNLFDKNRNLVPILSVEGNEQLTDSRRGAGVYKKLTASMNSLQKNGIYFGVSVTVTNENLQNVTSEDFIDDLKNKGCKLVFFVEYVPVNHQTHHLAPTDEERALLDSRITDLRAKQDEMVFISFPGDEKSSGGCLAAGRGFFHINSDGGAEPCPFSPFSDTNIKDKSLLEALNSPLFQKLSDSEMLLQEHDGGCVLFKQEQAVKNLLK